MRPWSSRTHPPHTRNARCLVVALVALSLEACNSPVWAFGKTGHLGIYREALELLEATREDRCATDWPADSDWLPAAYYPDAGARYALDLASHLPDAFWQGLAASSGVGAADGWKQFMLDAAEKADAMNSSDHYFDPGCPPCNVAGLAAAMGRGAPPVEYLDEALSETLGTPVRLTGGQASLVAGGFVFWVLPALPLPGQWLTFDEYVKTPDLRLRITPEAAEAIGAWLAATAARLAVGGGTDALPSLPGSLGLGPDGDGYNAVTSTLYLLNGSADGGRTNPCVLAPPEGALALLRQSSAASATGDVRRADASFRAALVDLGSAVHYISDLHSPGHTDWYSWPLSDHGKFDSLGDDLFRDGEVQPALLRRLYPTEEPLGPRLLLTGSGVCRDQGAAGSSPERGAPLWRTDLGAVFLQATDSSAGIWRGRATYAGDLSDHVANAVRLCAGVIDWSFSRAAEPDAPYPRDATNFAGMASAIALGLAPEGVGLIRTFAELAGEQYGCSVGGVDRDDYLVVTGPAPTSVKVVAEGRPGAIMVDVLLPGFEALDLGNGLSGSRPTATPLAERLGGSAVGNATEIDLGPFVASLADGPVLIRVYCPQGSACRYRFQATSVRPTTPPPGPGPIPQLAGQKALVLPFVREPLPDGAVVGEAVADQYLQHFWAALSQKVDAGASYLEYQRHGSAELIARAQRGDVEAVRELAAASGRRWVLSGTLMPTLGGRMFARVTLHDGSGIHDNQGWGTSEPWTPPWRLNIESIAPPMNYLPQLDDQR